MGPRFPPLLTLFIYFFCLCLIRFSLLLFLLYALILIPPSLVPLAGHLQTPHQAAGQPFKFTIPESLDRIKEEFQFLQAQYHRCVWTWSGWWSPGGGVGVSLLRHRQAARAAVLRACVQVVACGVTVKPCHSRYPPFVALPGPSLLLSPPPPIVSPFAHLWQFQGVPFRVFWSCMRTVNICASFIYFATG